MLLSAFALLLAGCANAGKDQSVVSNTTVILDGSTSKADFNGEIKKYRWKQVQGKKVKLSSKKNIKPNFTAPVVTKETTLRFRLTTVERGGFYSPWRTRDEVRITVMPSSENLTPPSALIEIDKMSVKYGESITFDANGSVDTDGEIVSYEWKDENNLTLSAEVTFEHTFDTIGSHTLMLTVTDNDGLSSTESVTVTVNTLQPPKAQIGVDKETVWVGESITFDANASTDADGEIVSYQWLDEKNTTISNQKSFVHTFSTSGEHTITLTVMDDDGEVDSATVNVVAKAQLTSIALTSELSFLDINATTSLSAMGEYSDNSTLDISSNVEWIIADSTIVSVDANGTLTALQSGTTTIQAKVDAILSNTIQVQVKTPISLESITVAPNPIAIRVGESMQIDVTGSYSDGSTKAVEDANYVIDDSSVVSVDTAGVLEAHVLGSTALRVNAEGVFSSLVYVTVGEELNTTNFNFTNFGSTYTNQIPVNATLTQYDEKRFCMIAGQILAEDGSPLQGVKVSIHKHPEYGTVVTDTNGTYVIPSEGGLTLTMRYSKNGYTTIDRKVSAPVQDWVRTDDVTMLAQDAKVTQIDLSTNTPQMHTSTPVNDDRGKRSTTLVFDGVSRATVTSSDGSTSILTNISVRATEFKTPESMPSDLPRESAYTYCSDLKIDGTNDNDEITFDAPVVMYVDNFLGFEVGEVVPVGYYDRNAGEWKASDNGVVVQLLDTDNDGVVDALDSTGDDLPNDLDGDGSVEDEVAGIQDNPNYVAGKSYWRAEMMHFTPWDHNWPYGPPEDAEKPDQKDPKSDDNEPNDCKIDVSSYVTGKSRVFHEDIPVAGTDITLHYSSKRVQGYNHIIDASVDTSTLPASVQGATVTLNVAGRSFTKTPDLSDLGNLKFTWDGRDALGNRVSGAVTATIKVSYMYEVVYLRGSRSFYCAWAKVGGASTGVRGRSTIQVSSSKSVKINVNAAQDSNSHIANGWTLSNIHSLGRQAVYKGDGTKLDKQSNLQDGLLAYYRFDGDASDSSFSGRDGYEAGNVLYVDGVKGQALSLDGTSHIKLDSFSNEDIARGLTYSYWFKKRKNFDNRCIFSQYTWEFTGHVFVTRINDEYIRVVNYYNLTGGSSDDFVSSYVNEEAWHHVLINSKKNSLEFWLDGQLVNSVLKKGENYVTNSSVQTYIGDSGPMGSGADRHFLGELDDFRVYNRELSISEINNIYEYGSGGVTSYDFDTLEISDNTLEYQFNLDGKHLSTKSYPNIKLLETYTYDENGYIETITNRFNEVTTIQRDAQGNPTQITAPNGQVTTLTVDEQGNLTQVSYEDNSKYEFTYYDGSLMDIMIDPNGNQIQHSFDANGRIVEEVDGEGGSYQFLRNVSGGETFYSTVYPEGETRTSRDVTLANGDTLSTMTNATGDTSTATFSADEMHSTSLRDGVETKYTYTTDSLTQQKTLASKEVTQPSGLKNTTAYVTTYDGNKTHTNSKTQTITNNTKTTTVQSDYNNGTRTLTTPTGRTATSTYDVDTLLTTQSATGTLTPTTYTYDDKGRVTQESTGSRRTHYTYDSRGNLATVTNPKGETTAYAYDIVDNLTSVTYPNNTTEHFSYDKNGNLLTRTVPTPADHSFTYNGTNNRTNYTSPLNLATTYSYDKSKNITAITKPSGKAITNTYNKGRLESTTTPEATTNYSYLFADKVGSISKGSENFSFTYDGTLVTSIVQSGLLNHTTDFSYNNDFQITSTAYAGQTENYTYDNDGLLLTSGAYTLTRDAQNAYVTSLTDGTLTQDRSYNNFGEITEVSDNTFAYQLTNRDSAGAITQKQETLDGTSITYDYTYDEMGRLTNVKKDNQEVETYTYDNNGNRASATVNGTSISASYTLDDSLVVYGDNTYMYDDDGYLEEKVTPDGTTTYSYSTMGELLTVTTPTQTITYKQNANNQRVAKLINGAVVEKYLWANLTTLLAIYDKDDNLKQRFEYADSRMPISMTQDGQQYYLHYDQVGSLRAVTDDSHNIVKEITYDTFGNILTDSNPSFKVPFGFAGGLYDSDTKLTRFGYRDYDAYTGKWTAKDPIGFSGGDSNLYGYVLGDPVGFFDHDGLINRRGGHGHNRNWDNSTLIGPAIFFGLNPRLDSPLERNLANHFFYGNGKPYYLSNEDWERLQDCPNSAKDPYFDQGIGALNPGSNGSIDTYDFYPIWGRHRTFFNNILNTGGAVVGYGFGGDDFKIYPPRGE